jgi:hypothetical protein
MDTLYFQADIIYRNGPFTDVKKIDVKISHALVTVKFKYYRTVP